MDKPVEPLARTNYRSRRQTELGEQFRRRRELRGMSQEEVAAASGVTQATISRLENGRNLTTVRWETLERVAQVLGMPLDSVLVRRAHVSDTPAESIVQSDRGAAYVARGYWLLSGADRRELLSFVTFKLTGQGEEAQRLIDEFRMVRAEPLAEARRKTTAVAAPLEEDSVGHEDVH